MKKIVFLTALCVEVLLAGCQATRSVVTEFHTDGTIARVTESGESVVKTLTDSTKNKTVVMWESGWAAYMSAATATTEDPTPTLKMFAGKTDKGVISALPEQQDWTGIAEVVNATKYDLTVGSTGITNQSPPAEKNTSEHKTSEN